jgi:hypothetical protein
MVAFGAVVLPAHGALHDRGNGLIYDDVLNITWLQDANYAATQYAQTGGAVGTANGEMQWQQALDWAANLTFDGYTDWHLPTAEPLNGSAYNYGPITYTGTGDSDFGFNITSTKKQMSNLYYVSLGNLSLADAAGHLNPGGGLTKTGPFKNIAITASNGGGASYWSGSADTSLGPDHTTIPTFFMPYGQAGQEYYYDPSSGITGYDPVHYAWAVRDGDVSLSPAILTSIATSGAIAAIPFSSTQVFTPAGQPVGTLTGVTGTVELITAGGSHITASNGQAVNVGDVLQTGDGGSFQVHLNDNSSVTVTPNTTFAVSSDLATAPHQDAGTFVDTLKTVFTYASDVVGKKDPGNHSTDIPDDEFGSLGIRADASKYINGNYLNPAAQLQVGSPITLSTAVNVPDSEFTLSFKYVFTTADGTLNVYLDDQLVGTITGSDDNLNTFEQADFEISDPSILDLGNVMLSFNFDGTHGDKVLIDDINMPGVINGDFTSFDQAWSATGPGSAYLTATISQDGYNELLSVPEPGMLSPLAAVGVLVFMRRRRGHLAH